MNIQEILNYYKDKNKSGLIRILKNNLEYTKAFNNLFHISDNLQENLYCYYNNITEIPKCPYCGKSRRFFNYSKGYKNTCGSKECTLKSRQDNVKNHRAKGNYSNVGNKHDYHLYYSDEDLQKEFEFYKNTLGDIMHRTDHNKIVKFFQQDVFYKKEFELLKKKFVREKLNKNRIKYIGKSLNEMSNEEVLRGLKIMGLYYGYSNFSPLWLKWFIEKYNISTLYDPCGGWGHHILGCLNIKKYIYNDLSKTTKENVDRIIKYFNIKNVETYNNNGMIFVPKEKCDAWFMCPPYYNLEHYECGDFNNIEEYSNFLNTIFKNWKNNDSKIFGIIIREDLLKYLKDGNSYKEKYNIGMNKEKSHFGKKLKEYLYVYCK